MEIFFAARIKGTAYGTHISIDMELIDESSVGGYEEILPGIGLLFKDSIEDTFKQGSFFVKKAMIDNYDAIKNEIITPGVFYIIKATADRVDYDPIVFYGATIKWLNEYLHTDINIPEYTYNRETRTFGIR